MATWHYKLFTVIHSVVANNNTINKYLTVKLKSINWFEGVAAIKILKSFQSPRNKVGPYSILSTWHPHFLLPPYICKSQSFPLGMHYSSLEKGECVLSSLGVNGGCKLNNFGMILFLLSCKCSSTETIFCYLKFWNVVILG